MNDTQRFVTVAGRVASVQRERIQVLNADGVGNSEIRHRVHVLNE